jgi:hypothetical protein
MRYHFWSLFALAAASAIAAPQVAAAWRARDPALRAGLWALAAVVAAGLATRLLDIRAFM